MLRQRLLQGVFSGLTATSEAAGSAVWCSNTATLTPSWAAAVGGALRGWSSATTTTASRTQDGAINGTLTASTSGKPPASQAAPRLAPPAPLGSGVSYQAPPLGSGRRAADPGEPKYTAPFWVPPAVRRELGLPNVLFVEPWKSAEDPALRRAHAQLALDFLRGADKPLTAQEIFEGVNSQNGHTFAHPSYVRMLMENLRRGRMVFGKKNPASKLGHGMPHHPRLYTPLPYQAAESGPPEELQRRAQAAKTKAIAKAYKRLRNRKTPYPIFRKQANFSILQYAQSVAAMEQLAQVAGSSTDVTQ